MQFGKLGVFTFTESMSAPQVATFAQRVESLGYSTLGYPEAVHYESFGLGLGVSHVPLVWGVRGHEYKKPLSTMRAYLDVMVFWGNADATKSKRRAGTGLEGAGGFDIAMIRPPAGNSFGEWTGASILLARRAIAIAIHSR